MSKIKLFCFPYAGGSSIIFNNWNEYLDNRIELIPVELAGRGKRIIEPLYADIPALINDVYNIVCNSIDDGPFALFGHSMGGMISYQLYQKLRDNNHQLPVHVFFSGANAPHADNPNEIKYHLLGEEEFKKGVIELGGTPPEFFEHPELLEVFLPLLKNDFKLSETNRHNGEINPLDINITVFLGKDEDLTTEQCDGWKLHTRKLCSVHYFEGGHFFLQEEMKQILRIINHTLLSNIYVEA